MSLLYRFSRRTFAELVRAGREWESETSLPSRRAPRPVRRRGRLTDPARAVAALVADRPTAP